MRVAVSGAGGRLGRALVAALADAPFTGLAGPIAWTRPDYDLDDGDAPLRLIERDRPEVVVHAAAWTDVDGAAKDRTLADQRNADAAGRLATTCAAHGIDFIFVSTNEVFDGTRTDGRGYRPDEPTDPINAYGRSKAAGEAQVAASYAGTSARFAIVRTAWLYGPPGNDFPSKIVAAALRARAAGERLRVVADEYGSPTSAADVAEAIVELIGSGEVAGTYHYVNVGAVSRADWAHEVLRLARVRRGHRGGPGVDLGPGLDAAALGRPRVEPDASGEPMRPWTEAMADYAPFLRQLPRRRLPRLRSGGPRDRPRAPVVLAVRRPLRRGRPPRRRAWCVPRAVASQFGPAGRDPAELAGVDGARFVQANLSSSTAGVLRGLHYHRRQLDHWIVASGRAFVALVDVRPAAAGTGPAGRRDAKARGRRLGRDPDRRGPWLPGARAARAGLLRHGGVRRQRRAGLRLGRPGGRRAVALPIGATADGRPILSERDRSNPTLVELVTRVRG